MMTRWQVDVILIASLITTLPSISMATSDPGAILCEPICWDEMALSDQCTEDRCPALQARRRAYRRCQNRCWNIVLPCMSLCRQNAMRLLEACDSTCSEGPGSTASTGSEDCYIYCFTHNMMMLKASSLSPNVMGSTSTMATPTTSSSIQTTSTTM